MKALKTVGLLLIVGVVLVLVLAARKPNSYTVKRTVRIDAPPEKVFPYLEDPKKTLEWSPWEKKDPMLKKTFSGAEKGKGAVYAWEGNREVGSGSLEITESVPPKSVVMTLRFLKPMKDEATARYDVAPVAGGSEVTWSIAGESNFVSKVMCVFMDMDKMIGGEFQKGLDSLKAVVEKK